MKISRRLSPIIIFGGVVVVGLAVPNLLRPGIASHTPSTVRADGGCSAASLNGRYAVEGHGTIVAQLSNLPAPPFPFGEASIAHFDGMGTFLGSAMVNFGGVVLSVPFTGTYTVNNDCTGNLTVNTNLGLAVHEAFVVIGGGQRLISTETDPFAVVERRVEKLQD